MKLKLIATTTAFLVTGCTVDRDLLSHLDAGHGPGNNAPAGQGGGGAMAGGTGGLTGGASIADMACESLLTAPGPTNNPCGPLRGDLRAVYSPDGQLLAVARDGLPPNIHLFRLRDGALLRSMGTSSGTLRVAFSPDGRMLASAGRGDGDGYSGAVHPNIVNVWDVATGALVRTLPATSGDLSDTVAFSHDGTWLVTGGLVGPIEEWRTGDWTRVKAIPYPTNVYNVHVSSDDSKLIVTSYDGRTTIWTLSTGTLALSLTARANNLPGDADFSPNAQRIVNQDADDAIKIWDTAGGTVVQTLTGPTGYLTAVVWIDDDRLVTAALGTPGTVTLWGATGGTFNQLKAWPLGALALAVSPDRTQLAVSSDEGITFLPL